MKAKSIIKQLWQPWILIIPLLTGPGTSSTVATDAPGTHRVPTTDGHRFLFVLEASKAMQKEADAAVAAIEELLNSGMQGQCRKGDTLGLWTFNDDLYTGRIPLQHWTTAEAREIHKRILGFINQQKCEKGANLDKLMPTLAQVVKDSDLLSVILVSTGVEEIHGTPFDSQINDYFRTWRDRQLKDAKPFITVLRGEKGKLTAYSVCPAPWPVNLPPLPPDHNPAALAQTKTEPPKSAAPRTVKPLIVTGSSNSKTMESTALSQPAATPVPDARTGYVLSGVQQRTAEQLVSNLLAEAGLPSTSTQKLQVVTSRSAETHSVAGTDSLVTNAPGLAASASQPQKVQPAEPLTHPAPTNNFVSAQGSPAAAGKVAEPAIAAKTAAVRVTPEPTTVKQLVAASSATAEPAPAPTVVPQSAATDEKPAGILTRKSTQLAVMAFMMGVLVTLFVAVRRPKAAYQPSIITRSLERESK